MTYDYIRQPDKIYDESFRLISEAVDLSGYSAVEAKVAERLVHTNGRVDVVDVLHISEVAVNAGVQALLKGAPILCDARMVTEGIIQRVLPNNNQVTCFLDQVAFEKDAQDTRSAKAVALWREQIEGSIIAIGNAPTALFRLLENLNDGWPKPALIVGMPVGFVGAAQSKQALIDDFPDVSSIALRGREGGSAYAAAAVNALSVLAKQHG
ncbi:MAG: precorrin-8X methylmutase [Alphaproteobacteria bacterium]